MKINRFGRFITILSSVFLLSSFSSPVNALDSKYKRNGEVYVLIGDGSEALKGIYRMNNAESDTIYPEPIRYLDNNDVNNSLGFTVDLNRHIYPFNETSSGWSQPEYIYRQVVDDVDFLQVDYGQHAYYHADHRFCYNADGAEVSWCRGKNIYRSNENRPSTNYIQNNSGNRIDSSNSTTAEKGAALYSKKKFYSLGPGEYYGTSLPADYKYVGTKVPIVDGKKWYKIKNNSWYSCWNTGKVSNYKKNKTYWNRHSSGDDSLMLDHFFWTVGEKESVNTHVYSVEEYYSKNGDGFDESNPKYKKLSTSNEVGRTSDVVVETFCRAGCLDGCGNANGGGTGTAERTISSVAFQPELTGSTTGDRRYFYARTNGTTDASIKLNGDIYDLSEVIGLPNNLTTEWIGISLAGLNSDFVYALGTDVIKEWYQIAAKSPLGSDHEITAVSVSNQWEEQGGIVFAYDGVANPPLIYKFVRDEKAGTISEYEVISCEDLADAINSENKEIDDIQADGFGSLFFGLSYPSKNMSTYNPTTKFKSSDAIHYHRGAEVMEGKAYDGCVLFRQNFSKVVYKRDYLSGVISKIGEIPYGYKFFYIPVTVPTAVASSLANDPSSWLNIINTAYTLASEDDKSSLFYIAGHEPRSYINSSDFTSGLGNCGCSTYKNQAGSSQDNPGRCKLGVINIPTPPEVRHIGPNKVSYLDICGPYTEVPLPPTPNIERITNQGSGIPGKLQTNTSYYYMVENYPLNEEKAQDPRTTPDCDNDGRWGGFVSSICNPKPNSEDTNGTVYYEWKTWLVEDPKGNPCCELYEHETNGGNSTGIWYYTKGKFIITCRVKYKWYDYDLLNFGDTVAKKTEIIKTNYAWPSNIGHDYDMASASNRLDEIMDTSDFAFMKKNPRDVEGYKINYKKKILGDLSTDNNKNQFWAIESAVVEGGDDQQDQEFKFIASLERCDDLGEYNSKKYLLPNARTKHGCADENYWYGVDPVTKEFIIEPDKKYYWRMALASQANILCDISKTTKYQESDRNSSDFNIIAYSLANEYIDGKKNPLYFNRPGLQFDPTVDGCCWWTPRVLEDGTETYPVKVKAFLKYKMPNGDIKTESLTSKINGDEVLVNMGSIDVWNNNNPITAETKANVAPPTDPMVGTISVEISRDFRYKYYMLVGDTRKEMKFPAKMPFTISAEASVRFLDTRKPEIEYKETSPINLFGLTGKKLAVSYTGETRTNPEKICFTMRDNNTSEASDEEGLTLSQHVENYIYNYGEEEGKIYCSGSIKMMELFSNAITNLKAKNEYDQINIKKRIEDTQKAKKRSSHLNYRPLYSKGAREVRLCFESSGMDKDGKIIHDFADQFAKFNTVDNKYASDSTMFNSDGSYYTYNDENSGLKHLIMKEDDSIDYHVPDSDKLSYLELIDKQVVDDESGNGYHSNLRFKMPLKYIKLQKDTETVPIGYANNTPGYRPYQFYVMFTDCSGNYTKVSGKKGYLPLNMALHVKDDIPPIPYGYICDEKTNRARIFPEEISDSPFSPFGSGDKPNSVIATNTSDNIPTYIMANIMSESFLRQNVWKAEGNNGYITGSNNKYRALSSLKPDANKISNIDIGEGKNGKISNDTIKNQLKNNVLSPGYVEDSVNCTFKVFASDNAGKSIATLTFLAYREYSDNTTVRLTNGYSINSLVKNYGTIDKDVTELKEMYPAIGECEAIFVGPTKKYPLIMPIMITAEDDAKDWDYYTGYVSNSTDPTVKNNIWGELKKGISKQNKRRFNTSIVIIDSNTDVRTLDKTLTSDK